MRTSYRIVMVILTVSCFLLPSSLLAKSITQTTKNKKFSVTMTTPDEGLTVGKNSISLKIYDADDYEVVGATVNIKPWMPGMGHGVFLDPIIQEKNNGVYEVDDVGISMPGHWQLVVSVKTDSIFDQTTFEFENIAGEMGSGCACGPDCKCEHCTTGKGPCACKAGAGTGCKMTGGKCQGNCSCGCKEGKPCQMKDGKCIGGCGCGCQADKAAFNCPCGTGGNCPKGCGCGCKTDKAAFNCPCGTGGNCPKSCKCGCQSTNVPNCKCGPGCTTLINCSCGDKCACAMDGKDGCGCIAGCRSGCPNGVCPLPKKASTS